MEAVQLSVIIPTRNRASVLARTLESVCQQTLNIHSFEVLVVDNGSSDNTSQVVGFFADRLPNLKYFLEPKPGLHEARHKGLREARTELLVFADDDIEAFPTWLSGIKESFQDPDVVLIGGKNLPKFETKPPAWIKHLWNKGGSGKHSIGYLSVLDLGNEVMEIDPYMVFGCNFSIRKSISLEAGGFHPDGFPQEMIKYRGDGESYISGYIKEKGYKALYNPQASVFHCIPKERMTTEYFMKRAFNQGISDSYSQLRKHHSLGINASQAYGMLQLKSFIKRWIPYTAIKAILNSDYAQYRIRSSYDNGFRFHRAAVRRNPQLLSYVLKPSYLEE